MLYSVNLKVCISKGLKYNDRVSCESGDWSVVSSIILTSETALSMFKAGLVKLLVLFARYRNSLQDSVFPKNAAKSNSIMRDIIRYVYGNFKEDITLELLSERSHLSASYISYGFRQFAGQKFHSFLESMRLAQACSLLMSSDMSITDIAYEVGFKSYKTFSRVFANRIKITPREYRKNSA